MNKTNVVTLVILAALLTVALIGQTKQSPPVSSQSGRYQLFEAESTPLGATVDLKTVLRIDTQTGNVDEWLAGKTKTGNMVDVWQRIGEVPPERQK